MSQSIPSIVITGDDFDALGNILNTAIAANEFNSDLWLNGMDIEAAHRILRLVNAETTRFLWETFNAIEKEKQVRTG